MRRKTPNIELCSAKGSASKSGGASTSAKKRIVPLKIERKNHCNAARFTGEVACRFHCRYATGKQGRKCTRTPVCGPVHAFSPTWELAATAQAMEERSAIAGTGKAASGAGYVKRSPRSAPAKTMLPEALIEPSTR